MFHSGTIDDVSALKKKYFLMDLNFGVDAANLKDWLDVDSHTATEILNEFCKSSKSKDSSSKMYLDYESPKCPCDAQVCPCISTL